mmetsp:Transcript_108517/g.221602  ORF Transcript_108517/g.221602 Transcript_108517/m.221602 type:complete len:320 (+) Transcript_108517:176-1135(+)
MGQGGHERERSATPARKIRAREIQQQQQQQTRRVVLLPRKRSAPQTQRMVPIRRSQQQGSRGRLPGLLRDSRPKKVVALAAGGAITLERLFLSGRSGRSLPDQHSNRNQAARGTNYQRESPVETTPAEEETGGNSKNNNNNARKNKANNNNPRQTRAAARGKNANKGGTTNHPRQAGPTAQGNNENKTNCNTNRKRNAFRVTTSAANSCKTCPTPQGSTGGDGNNATPHPSNTNSISRRNCSGGSAKGCDRCRGRMGFVRTPRPRYRRPRCDAEPSRSFGQQEQVLQAPARKNDDSLLQKQRRRQRRRVSRLCAMGPRR